MTRFKYLSLLTVTACALSWPLEAADGLGRELEPGGVADDHGVRLEADPEPVLGEQPGRVGVVGEHGRLGGLAAKIVGVESSDHATDRQIVAHVRHYFHADAPRLGVGSTH